MTFTHETIDFLTSSRGEALLAELASEDLSDAHTLALITKLRKTYTLDESAAALETARLRLKAVDKFGPDAMHMLFTRDALEQASHPLVRRYRASESIQSVLDVCCGIGSDALAFAAHGAQVTGIDLDVVRVRMAQHNAAVMDLEARFEVADAVSVDTGGYGLRFFDPARRSETGKRLFDVEQYIPPLSTVRGWTIPSWVKLSPGVDLAQIEAYGGRVEFISVNGDLKEALLRVEETQTQSPFATLITESDVHHWQRIAPDEDNPPTSAPRAWLIEPDAALIRAGLVQEAAQHFNGKQLDATIAYFTADEKPDSVWVRAWRVLDWMPFHLKKLRAYLNAENVGRVTVKKRGSPITPEELTAKLKLDKKHDGLKTDGSRTLVLTRHNDQPIVIICEDYAP